MTFFANFWVSFGCILALSAVVIAWLFRTTGAPLAAKIAVPALLVTLACYSPLAINQMLGLPLTASLASLPDRAELLAFLPHDEQHQVDLWLNAGDVPRAYETPLTNAMKATLREAAKEMAQGHRVMLAKRGAKGSGNGAEGHGGHRVEAPSTTDDQSEYVLQNDVFNLPAKTQGD